MIKLYSVMDDSLISSDIGGLFTSQEEAEAFKEEVVASNIENGMSKEYIRGGRFIRIVATLGESLLSGIIGTKQSIEEHSSPVQNYILRQAKRCNQCLTWHYKADLEQGVCSKCRKQPNVVGGKAHLDAFRKTQEHYKKLKTARTKQNQPKQTKGEEA